MAETKEKKKQWHNRIQNHNSGAVYGLGIIGAAVYYLINAGNLWEVILGLLKSLVWPAVLVFRLLEFLRM